VEEGGGKKNYKGMGGKVISRSCTVDQKIMRKNWGSEGAWEGGEDGDESSR